MTTPIELIDAYRRIASLQSEAARNRMWSERAERTPVAHRIPAIGLRLISLLRRAGSSPTPA